MARPGQDEEDDESEGDEDEDEDALRWKNSGAVKWNKEIIRPLFPRIKISACSARFCLCICVWTGGEMI